MSEALVVLLFLSRRPAWVPAHEQGLMEAGKGLSAVVRLCRAQRGHSDAPRPAQRGPRRRNPRALGFGAHSGAVPKCSPHRGRSALTQPPLNPTDRLGGDVRGPGCWGAHGFLVLAGKSSERAAQRYPPRPEQGRPGRGEAQKHRPSPAQRGEGGGGGSGCFRGLPRSCGQGSAAAPRVRDPPGCPAPSPRGSGPRGPGGGGAQRCAGRGAVRSGGARHRA